VTIVSICITSYNTRELLRQCIESVMRGVRGVGYEIIVADNGSSDGSVRMVADTFPQARLIVNARNMGFAAANNRAIGLSRGKYILLLNSDTIVLPGALERLAAFMDDHPRCGICGADLRHADGGPQSCYGLDTPTVFSMLLKELPFGRHVARLRGKRTVVLPGMDTPFEVQRIIGAALMARRKMVDAIGPLDERFFFYSEDLDWCVRARRAGWKIFCVPGARIVHYGGASSGGRADLEFYRSRCKFLSKYYGRVRPVLWRLAAAGAMLGAWGAALAASAYRIGNAVKQREHLRNARVCAAIMKYLTLEWSVR
jgi:GT2 family glycosyltransferase